ncbi:unnamed protein product [Trypanosoma congolense IL3000]|uniref:WGS project CAEQ00000000 data, annotated contig 2064 n=1 Tax=Trypanosoma congolense (strain IL3000) TaxID=1068625 RepID=F9WB57_TRYCI|nr:unnamed protein product [Trypanosoma congolense IL3000]
MALDMFGICAVPHHSLHGSVVSAQHFTPCNALRAACPCELSAHACSWCLCVCGLFVVLAPTGLCLAVDWNGRRAPAPHAATNIVCCGTYDFALTPGFPSIPLAGFGVHVPNCFRGICGHAPFELSWLKTNSDARLPCVEPPWRLADLRGDKLVADEILPNEYSPCRVGSVKVFSLLWVVTLCIE